MTQRGESGAGAPLAWLEAARKSPVDAATGKVRCRACGIAFNSFASLAQHVGSKHQGINSEDVKYQRSAAPVSSSGSFSIDAASFPALGGGGPLAARGPLTPAQATPPPAVARQSPQQGSQQQQGANRPQQQAGRPPAAPAQPTSRAASAPVPAPSAYRKKPATRVVLTSNALRAVTARPTKSTRTAPAAISKGRPVVGMLGTGRKGSAAAAAAVTVAIPEGLRLRGARKHRPTRIKQLVLRERADRALAVAQQAHAKSSAAFQELSGACEKLLGELKEAAEAAGLEPQRVAPAAAAERGGGADEGGREPQEQGRRGSGAQAGPGAGEGATPEPSGDGASVPSPLLVRVAVLQRAVLRAEQQLRKAAGLLDVTQQELLSKAQQRAKAYNIKEEPGEGQGKGGQKVGEEEVGGSGGGEAAGASGGSAQSVAGAVPSVTGQAEPVPAQLGPPVAGPAEAAGAGGEATDATAAGLADVGASATVSSVQPAAMSPASLLPSSSLAAGFTLLQPAMSSGDSRQLSVPQPATSTANASPPPKQQAATTSSPQLPAPQWGLSAAGAGAKPRMTLLFGGGLVGSDEDSSDSDDGHAGGSDGRGSAPQGWTDCLSKWGQQLPSARDPQLPSIASLAGKLGTPWAWGRPQVSSLAIERPSASAAAPRSQAAPAVVPQPGASQQQAPVGSAAACGTSLAVAQDKQQHLPSQPTSQQPLRTQPQPLSQQQQQQQQQQPSLASPPSEQAVPQTYSLWRPTSQPQVGAVLFGPSLLDDDDEEDDDDDGQDSGPVQGWLNPANGRDILTGWAQASGLNAQAVLAKGLAKGLSGGGSGSGLVGPYGRALGLLQGVTQTDALRGLGAATTATPSALPSAPLPANGPVVPRLPPQLGPPAAVPLAPGPSVSPPSRAPEELPPAGLAAAERPSAVPSSRPAPQPSIKVLSRAVHDPGTRAFEQQAPPPFSPPAPSAQRQPLDAAPASQVRQGSNAGASANSVTTALLQALASAGALSVPGLPSTSPSPRVTPPKEQQQPMPQPTAQPTIAVPPPPQALPPHQPLQPPVTWAQMLAPSATSRPPSGHQSHQQHQHQTLHRTLAAIAAANSPPSFFRPPPAPLAGPPTPRMQQQQQQEPQHHAQRASLPQNPTLGRAQPAVVLLQRGSRPEALQQTRGATAPPPPHRHHPPQEPAHQPSSLPPMPRSVAPAAPSNYFHAPPPPPPPPPPFGIPKPAAAGASFMPSAEAGSREPATTAGCGTRLRLGAAPFTPSSLVDMTQQQSQPRPPPDPEPPPLSAHPQQHQDQRQQLQQDQQHQQRQQPQPQPQQQPQKQRKPQLQQQGAQQQEQQDTSPAAAVASESGLALQGGGQFNCDLCSVQCNSDVNLRQHLASKKHLARAARAASADVEAAAKELQVASTIGKPAAITYVGPNAVGHNLCKQMIAPELNALVSDLLLRVKGFQERGLAKNAMKAHRWYVCGLREVRKTVKLQRAKSVVVAPNIESTESAGGLDDHLQDILDTCSGQGTPVVFALTRKRLGMQFGFRKRVSAVALLDFTG